MPMIVLLVLHLFLVNLPTLRGQTYVEGKLNRYVLQRFFSRLSSAKKNVRMLLLFKQLNKLKAECLKKATRYLSVCYQKNT